MKKVTEQRTTTLVETIVVNNKFEKEYNTFNELVTILPIEKVKVGEMVRLVGRKVVFTRKPFCKSDKKYLLQAYDNGNDTMKKKGTLVEIGFTF